MKKLIFTLLFVSSCSSDSFAKVFKINILRNKENIVVCTIRGVINQLGCETIINSNEYQVSYELPKGKIYGIKGELLNPND